MIYDVDDLVDELESKKSGGLPVEVDGHSIICVEFESNHMNIHVDLSDVYDELDQLKDEVRDLEEDLEAKSEVMEAINASIGSIDEQILEYSKFHKDEWEHLSKLDIDVLSDFVKTATNWYNITKRYGL